MLDLHVHSTASDGTLTPEAIVADSLAKGLLALALADHDSVEGIDRARAAAAGSPLLVLPAVEISTDYQSTEVHILGYFLDYYDPELLEKLTAIRAAREGRAEQMVALLRRHGLDITYEQVLARADGGSVGRPHVAGVLLELGYVNTPQDAFDRYLGRGKPAYVPRYKLTPQEAIALLQRCRGLPVLSHPGLIHNDRLVGELLSEGIAGLEAYHSAHTPAQSAKYARLARERGLLITCGTDSHGPGGSIPVEIGSVPLPQEEEALEKLLEWGRGHGRWEG
jgi:predicted metal-dependent phosphoesterase TrpH